VPLPDREVPRRSAVLDDPVFDSGIVLFVVRRLAIDVLASLAARGEAAAAVHVTLQRSLRRDAPPVCVDVRTAEPTLDEAVLLDLVRLGLEHHARRELAGSSIVEIEVEMEAAAAPVEQLRLFRERSGRDLAAAARAVARVKAELGEDTVVRAVLREGHLPEAGYAWESVTAVRAPSPRAVRLRPLVRRIYSQAIALPPKPFRERDDCWIPPAAGDTDAAGRAGAGGNAHGRVDHMTGPYIVSGGWWNREIHREYHYARTEDGEILWVYYDRHRRRWYLAGRLE
jgi:protein ImuB